MKIKFFEEYYYDDKGNEYKNLEAAERKTKGRIYYIPTDLEKFIPELQDIKNRLRYINDSLENKGPLDDDIEDVIDTLDIVLKKWENRPINAAAKKYNL